MNTKQVEELTGMSRQNIRYYERMGLLEPAREDGNAYRDYSREDIKRLKLIKMLRMLDMPLKDIEDIINEKVSLKEAVKHQREVLQTHQKQLSAAIEVCAGISRDKNDSLDVDEYLCRMETMERSGGAFARIVDDYKQVASEERERKFIFYTERPVNTSGEFEKVLRDYGKEHGEKIKFLKKGKYPEFMLGTDVYTAVSVLEKKKGDSGTCAKIVCEKKEPGNGNARIPGGRRRMLRGIHIISTNIRRYRKKTVLNLLLSMMTVMVLSFYLGNMESARRQLEDLPENFTIEGEIWNVCGEMNHGLFISHQVLDGMYASPYIGDIAESSTLMGNLLSVETADVERAAESAGADDTEETGPDDLELLGVNRMDCIDGMTGDDIIWEDGMDWEKFQDGGNACILSAEFAENAGLEPGDTGTFSLARYSQGLAGVILEREELLNETFEIAGIYQDVPDRDGGNPQVLLPLDVVKKIYERNDKVYFASSLSFTVTDPMQLDEAIRDLDAAGLQEIIYGSPSSYVGVGVRLADADFIRAMESSDRSLALLRSFLPFIFLIVAVAGYIIPSLLFQSRREEYAVMRALGTGKHFCAVIFYAEHILPATAGAALGAAAGLAAGASDTGGAFFVWGMYLVFYMLGAAAAMWKFGRFSIAAVLSHRD